MWGYDNEPYKDDDDQKSLESCLRCDPRLTTQSQSPVTDTLPTGKLAQQAGDNPYFSSVLPLTTAVQDF